MGQLVIDDLGHYVDRQRLEPGMTIRRYDEVAGGWFEGEICEMSSYSFEKQERITGLALRVEGFVASPLQEGQLIEIVSKAELHNREMDERNRIARENVEKPWLPLYDGE